MEEATITITEAITGLIEAGGPAALWGLVVYMGFAVLKTAIVAGAWIWIISSTFKVLSSTLRAYWDQDTRSIHLLSAEVSKDLHSHLGSWDARLQDSYANLSREVSKLRGELEVLRQTSPGSAPGPTTTTGEPESDDSERKNKNE